MCAQHAAPYTGPDPVAALEYAGEAIPGAKPVPMPLTCGQAPSHHTCITGLP